MPADNPFSIAQRWKLGIPPPGEDWSWLVRRLGELERTLGLLHSYLENPADFWTPTLTNVLNLDATTAYPCHYLRAGKEVAFAGKLDANPTGAGLVQIGISIPIPSAFTAEEDCGGCAFSPAVAGQGAAILADVTNRRIEMRWTAVDTANRSMFFSGCYRVR